MRSEARQVGGLSSAARAGLLALCGAILVVGHLLEKELRERRGAADEAEAPRALLLQPFRGAELPQVPPTAPDGGPLPGEPRTYVVQPGDTLGGIAQKTLGTTRGWRAILRLNADTLASPESLREGQKLRIPGPSWEAWLARQEGRTPRALGGQTGPPPGPEPAARAESAPEHDADERSVYVVRQGDTLGGIAQQTLGSVRHAPRLLEANRELLEDPDRLRVGMRLRVPDAP